jgi:hypothetical protein
MVRAGGHLGRGRHGRGELRLLRDGRPLPGHLGRHFSLRPTHTKDQAVQTAKAAADQTASTASKASVLAFVALVLGGAAAFGGSLVVQRRVTFAEPIGHGGSAPDLSGVHMSKLRC